MDGEAPQGTMRDESPSIKYIFRPGWWCIESPKRPVYDPSKRHLGVTCLHYEVFSSRKLMRKPIEENDPSPQLKIVRRFGRGENDFLACAKKRRR